MIVNRPSRLYSLTVPQLLSTSDAARIMGVGTTSVKRWADTGLLDCVRTAGGHRRFTRDSLDRFIRLQCQEESLVDEVGRWVDTLLSEMSHELALVRARGRAGSWCRVADDLAPVLVELGERWAQGEVSVAEEHIFSGRLSRALARIAESLPLLPNAPTCLLACVESEEHSLGLSLAELCFREMGWASVWLGPRTPAEAIAERVRMDSRIRLVGLSASEACADRSVLHRFETIIGTVCLERNIELILGGRGPWTEVPSYGNRAGGSHGFEDLQKRLLRRNGTRRMQ